MAGTGSWLFALVFTSQLSLLAAQSKACTALPDAAKYGTPEDPDKIRCRDKAAQNYKANCKMQLICRDSKQPSVLGYFEDDPEGDGITVWCNNGKWTSDDGELQECKPGCLVKYDMQNATYVQQPKKMYKNGKDLIVPLNTRVKTSCKPGYQFTGEDFIENNEDDYVCKKLTVIPEYIDAKGKGGMPAKCTGQCEPLDTSKLPEGIIMTMDPTKDKNLFLPVSGKLGPKAIYEFKCKPGYDLVPPYFKYGYQRMTCMGGEVEYVDIKGNKSKIATCETAKCDTIAQNVSANAVADYTPGFECRCVCNRKVSGCTVTVRCDKGGYFMPNYPSGLKLKCDLGKWVDESGKEVKPDKNGIYGGTCEPGCAKMTDSQLATVNITSQPSNPSTGNDGSEFYPKGTNIATTCKPNYIRPGTGPQPTGPDYFVCTDDGWKNQNQVQSNLNNNDPGKCIPACLVPDPSSSSIIKTSVAPQKAQDGKFYIGAGVNITTTCSKDFEPSDKDQKSPQVLVCVGGPNGYKDPDSGKNNVSPLTCVPEGATGCPVVKPDGQFTDVTSTGNCTMQDNMVPMGCKYHIKCKEGYIPTDGTDTTGDGSQDIECKAKKDGYQDSTTGKKNVKPLSCQAACLHVKDMRGAKYVDAPPADSIVSYGGKQYVKEGTKATVTCLKDQGFAFNTYDDQQRTTPAAYVCMGGPSLYRKDGEFKRVPGDCCGGVCKALPSDQPQGDLVQEVPKPLSTSYIENSIRYVVNMEYSITCIKTYEFPKGSPEATKGKQRLLCIGGPEQYIDLDTNKTNAQPTQCIKSEEPKCDLIDSTGLNLDAKLSDNCKESAKKVVIGCVETLTCKKNYFPIVNSKVPKVPQKVQCTLDEKDNIGEWDDQGTGKPGDILKCQRGCDVPMKQNAVTEVSHSPTTTSSGVEYYTPGSWVAVKCKPGYIALIGGMPTVDKVMNYTCTPSDETDPWLGDVRMEPYPGSACQKPCKALEVNGAGRITKQAPSTFTLSNQQYVAQRQKYVYQCKPDYHYPSDPAMNPDKEQQLYCDGDTGTYIDLTNGNKTVTAPENCVKNEGPGCPDLSGNNTVIGSTSNCNEKEGFKTGCKVVMKCKPGTIPTDPTKYPTGEQELTCPNGNEWEDKDGNKVISPIQCIEVCEIDMTGSNKYVEVVKIGAGEISFGGKTYVKVNDVVSTKCKGKDVIWKPKPENTNSINRYTCLGSTSGFEREEDKAIHVKIGDGCTPTCPVAMFKVPNSVDATNPPTVTYNGAQRVYAGDSYTYKCKPKFEYPKGVPPAASGLESAQCKPDGGEDYIDATGQTFKNVTPCERVRQPSECNGIKQDNDTTSSVLINCVFQGNFVESGCRINVKCRNGYYPENVAYLTSPGQQEIVCAKDQATGEIGWSDQTGKVITTPLKCLEGCANITDGSTSTNTITKEFSRTDPVLGELIAKCENATTTTSVGSPYACNNSISYPTDTHCTNACRTLTNVPTGVEVVEKPPQLDVNLPYTFGKLGYVLKCATGYMYPPSDKVHSKNGQQRLVCNGASHNYDDPDTGKKNADVANCIEAPGCPVLDDKPNVQPPSEVTRCERKDNFYSDKCTLIYDCKEGYYPSEPEYLYGNGQKIVCDSSKPAWLDNWKRPVKQQLTCVSGCATINYTEIAYYLKTTTNVEISTTVVTDSKGGKHNCYDIVTMKEIRKIVENIIQTGSRYFCKTDNTDIYLDLENVCDDSCFARSNKNLPNFVTLASEPAIFHPPSNASLNYVPAGNGYTYKCADGYEYDAADPHSRDGQQILVCQANGTYTDSKLPGVSRPKIAKCVQSLGCRVPESATGVTMLTSTCKAKNGLVGLGCDITLTCDKGYYPRDPFWQSEPKQTVQCRTVLSAPAWWDLKQVKPAVLLDCVKGCLPPPTDGNKEFTLPNGMKCKSNKPQPIDPSVAKYYCNNGTNGGGDATTTCTNACEKLPIDSSLDVKEPDYKYNRYVANSDSYTVKCKDAGAVFVENNKPERILVCDAAKAEYYDRETMEVVKDVKDTCRVTKKPCDGNLSQEPNKKVESKCTADSKGMYPSGCTMSISCLAGKIDDPTTDATQVSYTCNNGKWDHDFTGISYDKLDVKCTNPDAKCVKPDLTNRVVLEKASCKTDQFAKDCELTYQCRPSYTWKNPTNPDKAHVYKCNGKDWVDQKTKKTFTVIEDDCQLACTFPASTDHVQVRQEQPTDVTEKYGLTATCVDGYVLKTDSSKNKVKYECDGSSKTWVDVDTGIELVPGSLDDLCTPEKSGPTVDCRNPKLTANVASNSVKCNKDNECTFIVQCKPGYQWDKPTQLNNPDYKHMYKCDANGFTDVVTQKYFKAIGDACVKPPYPCSPPQLNSGVNSLIGGTASNTAITLTCSDGLKWTPSTPNPDTATHNYKCTNGKWVDPTNNDEYDIITDKCEPTDSCSTDYDESGAVVRITCGDDGCYLMIYCGYGIGWKPISKTIHTEKYHCESKQWVDVVSGNPVIVSEDKNICTPPSPPGPGPNCQQPDVNNNVQIINKQCNGDDCSFIVECEYGYEWNPATAKRNPYYKHIYGCSKDGYRDLATDDIFQGKIPDVCEKSKHNCPPMNLNSGVNSKTSGGGTNANYTITCVNGLEWTPTTPNPKKKDHVYTCQNGKWVNLINNKKYDVIPDKCQPINGGPDGPDGGCPTNYNDSNVVVEIECDNSGCELKVFCGYGVNGVTWKKLHNLKYRCDENNKWVDETTGKDIEFSELENICIPPGPGPKPNCDLPQVSPNVDINNKQCSGKDCSYIVQCKYGYEWNSATAKRNPRFKHIYGCSKDGYKDLETNEVFPSKIPDVCEKSKHNCPQMQLNSGVNKKNSGNGANANYTLTCADGLEWTPETPNPKKKDHVYTCQNGKWVNLLNNKKYDVIPDKCQPSGEPGPGKCPTNYNDSNVVVDIECDNDNCELKVYCGYGVNGVTWKKLRNLKYRCGENNKWVDEETGKEVEFSELENICIPPGPKPNCEVPQVNDNVDVNNKQCSGDECSYIVQCKYGYDWNSATAKRNPRFKHIYGCSKDGYKDLVTGEVFPGKIPDVCEKSKHNCPQMELNSGVNKKPSGNGANANYTLTCDDGLEWTPETPNPKKKDHVYTCQDGKWVNLLNNKKYDVIPDKCQPSGGVGPGKCPTNYNDSNVVVEIKCDNNGCELKVFCGYGVNGVTWKKLRNLKYRCGENNKWVDEETGKDVEFSELENICIPPGPKPNCEIPEVNANVEVNNKQCSGDDCSYIVQCKYGYEWNSATSKRNPGFKHIYGCSNDGYKDLETNEVFPSKIPDVCEKSKHNCPQMQLNSGVNKKPSGNGANANYTLTCDNGLEWTPETPNPKKKDHVYTCLDGKWVNLLNNKKYDVIPDKCQPSGEPGPGKCPTNYNDSNVVVEISCDNDGCELKVFCGYGVNGVTWKKLRNLKYRCGENNKWIDEETGKEVEFSELENICIPPGPTPNCKIPEVNANVDVNNKQCSGSDCSYIVQCKYGYEWNSVTAKRNPRFKHIYGCSKDGYKDLETNEVFPSKIPDVCEKSKHNCPQMQLNSGVNKKSAGNGANANYTLTCDNGLEWTPETPNPKSKDHVYTCQNGKWVNLINKQKYDVISDKCQPIDKEPEGGCPTNYNDSNVVVVIKCDDTGCELKVYCGYGVNSAITWTTLHNKQYRCGAEKKWIDEETDKAVDFSEFSNICIPPEPTTNCKIPQVNSNVDIINRQCSGNDCSYIVQCKYGYEWNSPTAKRNPYYKHIYGCSKDGYKDLVTNDVFSGKIPDVCEKSKHNCPPMQLNSGVNSKTSGNGANANYTLTCDNGLEWTPTTPNPKSKDHVYTCQNGKWVNLINKQKYTTIPDKCQPTEGTGNCPTNYNDSNVVVVIDCDDNSCDLKVYCGYGVNSVSWKKLRNLKYHCSEDSKWINEGTGKTVDFSELSNICLPGGSNGSCKNPSIEDHVVVSNLNCKDDQDCTFILRCEDAYEWNTETTFRNSHPRHMYYCDENGYTDPVKYYYYPDHIPDTCVKPDYECLPPKLSHGVEKDVSDDGSTYTLTCANGLEWTPETPNPKTVEHVYKCDNGKWLNTEEDKSYKTIPDKCQPIEGCTTKYNESGVIIIINCGNHGCEVTVYCGYQVNSTSVTTRHYHPKYYCNKEHQWIDEATETAVDITNIKDICTPPKPDPGQDCQDPFKNIPKSSHLVGGHATGDCKKQGPCKFYVECEKDYVWNQRTYDRNSRDKHWYLCTKDGFIDESTNTFFMKITDVCEKPKHTCQSPGLPSNVAVDRSNDGKTVTISCEYGQEWTKDTENRKQPKHEYTCVSGKWVSKYSKKNYTRIPDRCQPKGGCGYISDTNKTSVNIGCGKKHCGMDVVCYITETIKIVTHVAYYCDEKQHLWVAVNTNQTIIDIDFNADDLCNGPTKPSTPGPKTTKQTTPTKTTKQTTTTRPITTKTTTKPITTKTTKTPLTTTTKPVTVTNYVECKYPENNGSIIDGDCDGTRDECEVVVECKGSTEWTNGGKDKKTIRCSHGHWDHTDCDDKDKPDTCKPDDCEELDVKRGLKVDYKCKKNAGGRYPKSCIANVKCRMGYKKNTYDPTTDYICKNGEWKSLGKPISPNLCVVDPTDPDECCKIPGVDVVCPAGHIATGCSVIIKCPDGQVWPDGTEGPENVTCVAGEWVSSRGKKVEKFEKDKCIPKQPGCADFKNCGVDANVKHDCDVKNGFVEKDCKAQVSCNSDYFIAADTKHAHTKSEIVCDGEHWRTVEGNYKVETPICKECRHRPHQTSKSIAIDAKIYRLKINGKPIIMSCNASSNSTQYEPIGEATPFDCFVPPMNRWTLNSTGYPCDSGCVIPTGRYVENMAAYKRLGYSPFLIPNLEENWIYDNDPVVYTGDKVELDCGSGRVWSISNKQKTEVLCNFKDNYGFWTLVDDSNVRIDLEGATRCVEA